MGVHGAKVNNRTQEEGEHEYRKALSRLLEILPGPHIIK